MKSISKYIIPTIPEQWREPWLKATKDVVVFTAIILLIYLVVLYYK